jgi:hypothetical protein
LEHDPDAAVGSDGEREVVECRAEPVVAADFGSDVVVTAAQILHEGVTSGEDPRRAVPLQAASSAAAGPSAAHDLPRVDYWRTAPR